MPTTSTQLVLEGYKRCGKCGIVKVLVGGFHKSRRYKGKQYYVSKCRACSNESARQWCKNNPEKRKEVRRRYRKNNLEEEKERSRQWKKNNREKIRETHRQYHKNNPEKIKEQNLRYRKNNPEKIKEQNLRNRQWRRNNPDRVKQYRRHYYKENYEKIRERQRQWNKNNLKHVQQWRKNNAEKLREQTRQWRARKNNAEGNFTELQFQALCNFYGNTCLHCGEPKELARDHVIPLSDNGSNYIQNIQPLCKSCNSSKGTNHTDYRKELPDWEELGRAT